MFYTRCYLKSRYVSLTVPNSSSSVGFFLQLQLHVEYSLQTCAGALYG